MTRAARRGARSAGGTRPPPPDAFERSPVRRALVWLAAIEIVGLILAFDASQQALHPIDLPKSLVATASAAVMLALLGLLLATFGRSIVPRSPVLVLLAAYVGAVAVSSLFAEDRFVAVFGYHSRYLGLVAIVDMAVLSVAVAVSCRYDADRRVLAGAVGAGTAIALLYGLVQILGLDPMRWTLSDPRVRPFSTLGNPDVFGHLLSVVVALAAGIALWPTGRIAPVRAAAIALALVALAMGSVVATRGIVLGVGAAVVVLAALYVRPATFRVRRRAAVMAAVASVLALGFLAASPLGVRVRDTFTGAALAADRRLVLDVGIQMFAERPLVGWGPDNFAVAFARHRPAESITIISASIADSPHDWLVDAAATTGLLGTLPLLALIAAGALALIRSAHRTVAAPLLMAGAAYWGHGLVSVGSFAIDWFPWVAFGLAAASTALPAAVPGMRTVSRRWQLAVVAVAVVAVAAGLRQLEVDQDAKTVSALIARGRPDVAAFAARTVIDRDPGRAEHWDIYGTALFAQKRWRPAGDAFQAAADRASYEPSYWQNVALARLNEGDGQAAFAAARRAIDADPNEPTPHATAAQVAAGIGMDDVALTEGITALRLHGDADSLARLIAASAGKVDPAPGRSALEEALRMTDAIPLRLALARLALKSNDLPTVRTNAERVLQLDPTNSDAKAILAALPR